VNDNEFIALGPAPVGFRTSATRIGKGVDVEGNELGVRGQGPFGVVGSGEEAGVHGIGKAFGRGGAFDPRGLEKLTRNVLQPGQDDD